MISGPSELAKSLLIPLDQTWSHNLVLSGENHSFVMKPIEHASMSSKASLLGYWNKPFKLNENDVTIITYTMPLFDNSGILKGVIGIDLTLNYLSKQLPTSELQPQDSLGYLIAFSSDEGNTLTPIVMGGALQQRMIDSAKPLEFKEINEKYNIHLLKDHFAKEDIFATLERIGLYPYNTPFEKEQWVLVGFMWSDFLMGYVNRIGQILWVTLALTIVLGTMGAVFISRQMTKPIVSLAKQVTESDPNNNMQFAATGLLELDELSKTIEIANHLMLESASRLTKIVELIELPLAAYEVNHETKRVFLTDKFWNTLLGKSVDISEEIEYTTFLATLSDYLSVPEPDEVDVYQVAEKPKRWIRYKETRQECTQIGVILDITEEILEKKKIKQERDHDALTGLLNRKGFQWAFEKWRNTSFSGSSAIIMFDLDCLKQINDTYGHKWGDVYIVNAVDHLKTLVEDGHGLLGRRSGDEFVMLIAGLESKSQVLKKLDGFYTSILERKIVFPDDTSRTVKISAGLMWIDDLNFSYDELLHFADEALYEAKGSNKGGYVISKT